jgi:hypothetical protein
LQKKETPTAYLSSKYPKPINIGRSTSDQSVDESVKLVFKAIPLSGDTEKAPPRGGPLIDKVVEATLKTPS